MTPSYPWSPHLLLQPQAPPPVLSLAAPPHLQFVSLWYPIGKLQKATDIQRTGFTLSMVS